MTNPLLKYLDLTCDVAIETGTWHGDTTLFLAQHYQHVHTIELSKQLYVSVMKKFKNISNISQWCGDSGILLPEVLKTIPDDKNITIFLDAHYSGGDTSRTAIASPLAQELEALIPHKHKVKQILIDDIEVCADISCGTATQPVYHEGWPNWEELEELLRLINPKFRWIVDKEIRPYWLLVANLI